MIARGALGYPWVFAELAGERSATEPPGPAEIVAELLWVLECAERHWGPERAARNLRKFYPWYLERLGVEGPEADAYQRTGELDQVRAMLGLRFGTAAPGSRPAGTHKAPLTGVAAPV
jgi:tRNA-dihydrouridine synthase B